ncbi:MAG: response regulator [Verrucomicrobia bacterium]|nr:response regulator [Verrucomicrobiota bacterium]MBI3867863.1 response regulator [Verrucomicrobiota bacterium]
MILLVDDDSISRRLLNAFLQRGGFEVVMAEGVDHALTLLESRPLEAIDAVVTDYRMPGKDGLWLLAWLQKTDPRLSAIMVTAEGEKHLVTATLRHGVCDFLDKPVDARALVAAAEKAVELTRHRRSQARAESDIRAVGLIQRQMVGGALPDSGLDIAMCYLPMHEAGGDYFIGMPLGGDRFLLMATDVSGHDLSAAYLSSYFQGFVRGMLEARTPIESVLSKFNDHLLEEASRSDSDATRAQITSVAVAAVLLNREELGLQSVTCGFPAPVYSDGAGRVQSLSEEGSSPLGWFPDTVAPPLQIRAETGSSLYFWTDGLEDVASEMGVLPMTCAYDLLRARATGSTPLWMKRAADDILVARVALTPPAKGRPEFIPILHARYPGCDWERIDAIQDVWTRSFRLALPELGDEGSYDILLCLREVVINALKHGCRGQADSCATLMISWDSSSATVRVIVSDPGPGHDFDWMEHARAAADQLIDAHRGLMMINGMAARFETKRKGAWVEMDFNANPALKKRAS